jgi:hypothetical protein
MPPPMMVVSVMILAPVMVGTAVGLGKWMRTYDVYKHIILDVKCYRCDEVLREENG